MHIHCTASRCHSLPWRHPSLLCHRNSRLNLATARLLMASTLPVKSMRSFAIAVICNSMPLLRRYDLCHAIALPLLSFRCHAFSQLIEADPLLRQSKLCLRLAFPRLSIASLSMPTQGVSTHCRCEAYLSNASPLLRCTRLFVATPLLHFAAPQRLIRSLPIRTGPCLNFATDQGLSAFRSRATHGPHPCQHQPGS